LPDQIVLREFLAVLGYRVDESAQRRFMDSITSMSNAVLGLGAGITAAAGAVTAAVANMASSGAQMSYFAQTLNETVSNVDAIVFAWQKLGLAPQQTMTALQSLANMMRTEPGLAGLWNERAGPGSLTQQFEHMGERFAQMSSEQQRVFRSQFEKYLGTDVINAWMTRGLQAGGGVQEFNVVKRLFHFDPDYFAEQSKQFEQAWSSFQLRLNDIGGHAATPILVEMNRGLRDLTTWIDQHHDEIIQKIDDIGKVIRDTFMGGVDLVRDTVNWFTRLSPASKEAAEAIAVLGLAFLKPGWARVAAIAYAIETLLRDYEAFKKTGQSPLGIPWDQIGHQIDNITKQLGELNNATGGLLSPLHAIELFFGLRLLLAARGFFSAVTIGSATAATAITGTLGGALRGVLSLIPKAGPLAFLLGTGAAGGEDAEFSAQKNEEFKRNNSTFGGGGGLSDWIRHQLGYDTDPRYGGQGGPAQQGGSSMWEKLGNVLSYLNPISVAQGAELPGNIKDLTQQMAILNDHFSEMNENGAGGFGSWATGLGAGIVSGLFGGGGSQGESKGVNSPEAIEAVKYFMGKGWSLPQAIGIVANLLQESGLNPGAENSTGHVGVAQWDKPRQMMYQMRTGRSLSREDRLKQYDYVDYEMRHNEAAAGFALGQTGDPASSTMAFDRFYERSGGAEIGRRLANARALTRALGSDPNVRNATFTGGSVTQTNNVTINTTADPNAIRSAFDQQHQRQLADLQRNQQGALH